MYYNGMFCLDLWDTNATYAIFDDFEDWSKFYMYKQFLGAQQQFVVTDKYRKKKNVDWGKPCIILANTLPDFKDWKWIEANCFIEIINSNLF